MGAIAMPRAALCILKLALPLSALVFPAAHAQQYSLDPPFWAVTGVRANDVLHLRDMPSAESKSLAGIPANAQGLKNLGCRRDGPSLDQWARMSKAQREVPPTPWCRVDYQGKQGWVAARFLRKDARTGSAGSAQ
jgi:hypothetical protein